LSGVEDRRVGNPKHSPRLEQETATGVREPNGSAGAIEEAYAEHALENLYLSAQWRLRHVQPIGRASEMKLLRDGDEAAKLIQLKHAAP
jgi:hypothetical protein